MKLNTDFDKHIMSYLPLPAPCLTVLNHQVEALSAEGEPSEEQQQVLNGLQDRVNQAIELYGEEGAMVRIGGRSVHIHSQTYWQFYTFVS